MAWSTADIPPQQGRLIIITGTGGLGYEAALVLARAGGKVVLAGRNRNKGDEAIGRIGEAVPNADIRFEELDLASLASVKAFAERMDAAGKPLDVLVNNAGVMGIPTRKTTQDGFELQFGTNYLGHFALTMRLLPLLFKAEAPRVVSLSSSMHRMASIRFDDLQSESRYSPNSVYGETKLAMLMFALELDRCVKVAGVPLVSTAAHPGIARTDLITNGPTGRPVLQFFAELTGRLVGQSAADGALPVLRAATDPAVKGGEYYGPSGFQEIKGPPALAKMSDRAKDPAAAKRLWEASVALTQVYPPAPIQ